jgi:hypothetical protein
MIFYILYVIGYFISFMLFKHALKDVAGSWNIFDKAIAYIFSLLSWLFLLWFAGLLIYGKYKNRR